jgi:iron-sulfur cluster repair protein YtfE (RIC family)
MTDGNKYLAAMIDTLSAEHRDLLPELARLADEVTAPAEALRAAFDQVARKLGLPLDEHIANEDRELFPAYAAAGGDTGVLAHFSEEHREILSLRNRLVAAIDVNDDISEVRSLVEQLTDLLSSHMNREDEMLFPDMRNTLSARWSPIS